MIKKLNQVDDQQLVEEKETCLGFLIDISKALPSEEPKLPLFRIVF